MLIVRAKQQHDLNCPQAHVPLHTRSHARSNPDLSSTPRTAHQCLLFGIKICRARGSQKKKLLSPAVLSPAATNYPPPLENVEKPFECSRSGPTRTTNGSRPFCYPLRPCDFAKVASVALFTPPPLLLHQASSPNHPATTLPARISIPFCVTGRETVLPYPTE